MWSGCAGGEAEKRGWEGAGRLSGTVKCNPKSTASSSTTILMEMGNILYQGYHILLEMTVSKVGVETMATKQLFASSPSRREARLSDREGPASERSVRVHGRGESRRPVAPDSFVPSLLFPHFGI